MLVYQRVNRPFFHLDLCAPGHWSQVTEQHLRSLFEGVGEVKEVFVINQAAALWVEILTKGRASHRWHRQKVQPMFLAIFSEFVNWIITLW
jgi:hypothetical protein